MHGDWVSWSEARKYQWNKRKKRCHATPYRFQNGWFLNASYRCSLSFSFDHDESSSTEVDWPWAIWTTDCSPPGHEPDVASITGISSSVSDATANFLPPAFLPHWSRTPEFQISPKVIIAVAAYFMCLFNGPCDCRFGRDMLNARTVYMDSLVRCKGNWRMCIQTFSCHNYPRTRLQDRFPRCVSQF